MLSNVICINFPNVYTICWIINHMFIYNIYTSSHSAAVSVVWGWLLVICMSVMSIIKLWICRAQGFISEITFWRKQNIKHVFKGYVISGLFWSFHSVHKATVCLPVCSLAFFVYSLMFWQPVILQHHLVSTANVTEVRNVFWPPCSWFGYALSFNISWLYYTYT